MIPRFSSLPLIVCSALAFTSIASAEVTLKQEADKVSVLFDGQLFTEYHFTGARRPYLYPVIGPTGAGMTRNWPLKEGVAGEETDHPHHKGVWFGHRSVSGAGFWEDSAKAGTKLGQIVHDSFAEVKGGKDEGVVRAKNKWVLDDGGEVIATDETTWRFAPVKGGRVIDFSITIKAGAKEIAFGDDKDGTMAIRLAETMRVERSKPKGEKTAPPGEGHIVTSEGKTDKDAWGTRAPWCDYFGPVEGKTVGVAMFDHPSNPRYPTWWHVRTYGLFAANPFGQAQFEKLPEKNAGEFKVAAGQSVTFRYRLFFHEGDATQGKVAEQYRDYVAAVK